MSGLPVGGDDVEGDDRRDLAAVLAEAARRARDAVLGVVGERPPAELAAIVREGGGDVVFGVDAIADEVLVSALQELAGERWPGTLVCEGFDERIPVGDPDGPWTYLADPFDGSRAWLAGKRSAYVLIGAGREATTLEDLEVGAAAEVPTPRGRLSLVAWACEGDDRGEAVDDDLATGARHPRPLRPRATAELRRTFVTVARYAPGQKAAVGSWEDEVLADLEVYEDPWLCSGGQLLGLATGSDAAVLDPRPLFGAAHSAHPYDLACLVVARAAGVVVEAIPPGPLDVPIATDADVAWAGYANPEIADLLRRRVAAAALPPTSGDGDGEPEAG